MPEREELKEIHERIDRAEGFESLRVCRDSAHALFGDPRSFPGIARWNAEMNRIHDRLIRRTIKLSERMLESRGFGAPPVPYAFVLFGSGGRSEQTLWSDQDNGVIFADDGRGEREAEEYFHLLVGSILHGLEILGHPPCHGNVLSSNPRWRKPLGDWFEMLREWFAEPTWEHVRYMLIAADIRCVYGEADYALALVDELERFASGHPEMLGSMLRNTLHRKIAIGLFGQLITERYGEDAGGFDVKYGAYIPMVNGGWLLAIAHRIRATSTLERIERLQEVGVLSPDRAADWRNAFELALKLRSETPFRLEGGLYVTRGKLPETELTKERRNELKLCLSVGRDMQRFVRRHISGIQKRAPS